MTRPWRFFLPIFFLAAHCRLNNGGLLAWGSEKVSKSLEVVMKAALSGGYLAIISILMHHVASVRQHPWHVATSMDFDQFL